MYGDSLGVCGYPAHPLQRSVNKAMAAQTVEPPMKKWLGRVTEGVAVVVIVGFLSEAYQVMKAVLQGLDAIKNRQETQQLVIDQLRDDGRAIKASGAEVQKKIGELERELVLQGFQLRQLSKER